MESWLVEIYKIILLHGAQGPGPIIHKTNIKFGF
jgi:hypothetical protein